jgi:alpha-galactosidase
MKNDLRIVVIGAGSVSFGLSTLGDLMTKGFEPLSGSTIVLHDISDENLRLMTGVLKNAVAEATDDGEPAAYKVESTTNLKEALQGANHVIMSIEHGNRMKHWEEDYYIPRKYGSRQIFGEDGGPGGAFHTWRQIPPMLKIAHTMEDLCPDAWLFNYSNPLCRIQRSLAMATKIKTVGLCHGVGSVINAFPSIIDCKIDNMDMISAGLNHFFWVIKANAINPFRMAALGPHPAQDIAAGQDLIPLIRSRGQTWARDKEMPLIEEFLKTYGYLTYPGQSHPGEYVYWADSLAPSVKYDFKGYAAGGNAEKERLDRTLTGNELNYWWVHPSGERVIDIIIGMEYNDNHMERAVNMPNHGSITNLPYDCVIEVPATINKSGIHNISVGNMPDGIAQLLQHEAAVQELVAKAAVTGDKNTAIQALMLDGTLPSPAVARALFNEMLEVQKDFLPQFK